MGFGSPISGSGSRVSSLGFWCSGLGSRFSVSGSRVPGLGFLVGSLGFGISCFVVLGHFRGSVFGIWGFRLLTRCPGTASGWPLLPRRVCLPFGIIFVVRVCFFFEVLGFGV